MEGNISPADCKSELREQTSFAFTDELFPFMLFIFLVVSFSCSLGEVPLIFLVKLFWWC